MVFKVLWVGHEAECYVLGDGANIESTSGGSAHDASYERVGMVAGVFGDGGTLTSTPDWPAANEIWHRFNQRVSGNYATGKLLWALQTAGALNIAQLVIVDGTDAQFQVWNGGGYDIIATIPLLPVGSTYRWDVHFRGGAGGQVEVYYGPTGVQTKVVDVAADFPSAIGAVRIYHEGAAGGAGSNTTWVAHEIVQTFSTLSSTSEVKPPTAQGTDADGTGDYTAIDEVTFSDVDFVALTATGQHQSYTSPARAQTQNVVSGITISCRAWYEAGGPTSIKPYLKIGGVRYYGTSFALDLIPLGYQYTFPTNPATGVAFTTAEANDAALEWGWEAVA